MRQAGGGGEELAFRGRRGAASGGRALVGPSRCARMGLRAGVRYSVRGWAQRAGSVSIGFLAAFSSARSGWLGLQENMAPIN
jgi:hypothetical protein